MVNEVESSHVFPTYNGNKSFSWKGNLKKIKSLFVNAKTSTDVYYAILAFQKNLKNNHSSLRMPNEFYKFKTKSKSLPFRLSYSGADYLVSISEHPKIKKGFVLKSLDGKTISQLEEELLIWHGSSSMEHFRQEFSRLLTRPTAWKQPVPKSSSVKLKFHNPISGKSHILNLDWSKYDLKSEYSEETTCGDSLTYDKDYENYKVSYVGINYCLYESVLKNTLILRFFSFNYHLRERSLKKRLGMISPKHKDGLSLGSKPSILEKNDLKYLIEQINHKNVSNLLIDVRENRGGNINPELITALAKKKYKILERKFVFTNFSRSNKEYLQSALNHGGDKMRKLILQDFTDKTKNESRMFPFYCKTDECKIQEKFYSSSMKIKVKNIFILSGPYCLSSCDQFVSILRDNDLAIMLGLPSQGSHAPFRANKKFSLANGQEFSFHVVNGVGYRPNGEPLEGNPAEPLVKFYPHENSLEKSESIISKK